MAKGILIGNLGSPESTSIRDVRSYLRQFLMDKYVLDIPWFIRFLLVYFVITPFRSPKTAKAYQSIWRKEGSPLLYYTQKQKQLLAKKIPYELEIGMRYGEPSIMKAIQNLTFKGVDEIFVFPLYPHYAMSSYQTFVKETEKEASRYKKNNPSKDLNIKFHSVFYNHEKYIHSLTQVIKPYLEKGYDHILFSYHGIPERHIHKANKSNQPCKISAECCEHFSQAHKTCYRHQVIQTTKSIVEKNHIPKDKYQISFQSRLGRIPWLEPFTDEILAALPSQGIKKLLVVCPSFVSDCLETIEEINIRGRKIFLQNGGQSLILIPCLNHHPIWIQSMADMILNI